MLGEERLDLGSIAEELKGAVGTALQRQPGAGDDHGRTMVSPHRIERNADRLRHSPNRNPRP
jgi:hypothetical protein